MEEYKKEVEEYMDILQNEDWNDVEELYRAAHTIKGMSSMMGFNEISELASPIESIFKRAVEEDENIVKNSSVLKEGICSLKRLVEYRVSNMEPPDNKEIEEILKKLNEYDR